MNSASQVDQLIRQYKADGLPLSEAIFRTGTDCVGWPYVFGARGGTTTKNGIQVRQFDCRGFTYWCLKQFGITIEGAGCTTQWGNEANWRAKGDIGNIPDDILVCLFYRDKENPQKMAHTGFGYKGHTVECSSGVQYFDKRKSKWQYWAIPAGIGGDIPVPDTKPTLRKGDAGPYVTLAQTELINRGYDLGSYGADGKFGTKTEEAVKAFQRDWGLVQDGIVGPKTWAMLESTPAKVLFTVTVPHLSMAEADKLTAQYPGAIMTKEGDL